MAAFVTSGNVTELLPVLVDAVAVLALAKGSAGTAALLRVDTLGGMFAVEWRRFFRVLCGSEECASSLKK